ncbi:MAG: winged helix-turn-helix domain-containing protein [Proteobacteria bacterium]|nr:winged helix-turn-helix domain-containing protein [Pseudomonadota bacterium]
MSDFERELKSRCQRAQQRVSELTREAERLQQQRAAADMEVATWQEALLVERRRSGKIAEGAPDTVRPPLGQLSLGDAVMRVLERTGEPMHVKDILRELASENYHMGSKNMIATIVTTLTRRKQFRRVAPNTFALIEEGEEEPS